MSAVTFHRSNKNPTQSAVMWASSSSSSHPKTSDDHCSTHTDRLHPFMFLTACWTWHLTSCRNFASSHSNFYSKRAGDAAWGCCSNPSRTSHKNAKLQFLLRRTLNVIDPWLQLLWDRGEKDCHLPRSLPSLQGGGLATLWFTTRQFIYSPPLVAV